MSRIFENNLYMVRVTSGSTLWTLDLATGGWSQRETIGKRPLGFTNNPSTVIFGDYLFCAGYSQLIKPLQITENTSNPRNTSSSASISTRSISSNRERQDSLVSGEVNSPTSRPILIQTPAPSPSPSPSITLLHSGGVEVRKIYLRTKKNEKKQKELKGILQIGNSRANTFTDVTFLLGKEQIPLQGHRFILSSSDWFYDIFTQKHPDQQFIILPQYEFEQFKGVVDYLYGRFDIDQSNTELLLQIYKLSEDINLPELKKEVATHLERGTQNPENLIKLFFLTKELEPSPINDRLKRKAEEAVRENLPKIAKTESFTDLCQSSPEKVALLFRS